MTNDMINITNGWSWVIGILLFLGTIEGKSSAKAACSSCKVRVLLEETKQPLDSLTIGLSEAGEKPCFKLQALDASSRTVVGIPSSLLTIVVKSNKLYVNGKALASKRIKIEAMQGYLNFKNNAYEGAFILSYDGLVLRLINILDLESYVASVVRWESIPTWPSTVNEAAAIACRSYVFALLYQNRAKSKKSVGKNIDYDIRATNIHQTYKGVHNFAQVREAVHNTEGLILAYNKEPILAMYDVCCGGIIPAHLTGVDFSKAPYLARDYACTYCKNSKVYRWNAEYDIAHLELLLEEDHGKKIAIKDIRVSQKDKAGTVQEVKYKVGNKWMTLSGKKIYALFKEVKSFCFSVTKKLKKLQFGGFGWGHHLGMCQWGARQMAKEGCDAKAILRFYYPKAMLMKISVLPKFSQDTQDKGYVCLNTKSIL
jgi:stage II sporulation protein D